MLAGRANVGRAAQVPHEGGHATRRWPEEAGILLHEKPEHLALAHLTKMVRCIPQIEIISHSSLSR